MQLFSNIYLGKNILVTGHTGFKGSWLCFWLEQMGAKVYGVSDKITTDPSHFELLSLKTKSYFIDIRNKKELDNAIQGIKPDVIFHLAAQPLVRYSYKNPVETFEVNVIGTINLLEISRKSPYIKGMVNVTSDKCYENFEDDRAYKEEDRMGGYDPYSASKGAVELVSSSYRRSFFNPATYKKTHGFILANARAGNVIGGGDWSEDRLIPDLVRNRDSITEIRNPLSTRPWQHVLEPLSGYLLLGQNILEENVEVSDSWNFGPDQNETLAVGEVIKQAKKKWNTLQYKIKNENPVLHEASLLRLDCTKVNKTLNWHPVWSQEKAIEKTIQWYKDFYINQSINTKNNWEAYIKDAEKKKYPWIKK